MLGQSRTWIAISTLSVGLGLGAAAVASTETTAPVPQRRDVKKSTGTSDKDTKPVAEKKEADPAACVDPAKASAVNTLEALVVGGSETFGAALAAIETETPAAEPAPTPPTPPADPAPR
jgi:hypothetical protein